MKDSHPSGRPIRKDQRKNPLPIYREPQRESLIPGIRKEPTPRAELGFHAGGRLKKQKKDNG